MPKNKVKSVKSRATPKKVLRHKVHNITSPDHPFRIKWREIFSEKEVLRHPITALLIAHIIWGASAPITKLALLEISPNSLLFFRLILAAVILAPFIWHSREKMSRTDEVYIFLSAFFGTFLNTALFYIALPAVPSINAPIIGAIAPFFLALLAGLFLHEKISMRKYYGMGIGFAGIMLVTVLPLILPEGNQVLGVNSWALDPFAANLLLVMAAVSGAIGTLFLRPIRHLSGHVTAFWQFAIAACLVFPFILGENPIAQLAGIGFYGVLGILFAGILSSVVASVLYNQSLHKVKAGESGLFSYITPLAAIAVAGPLLGEWPNIWFVLGSLLIFLGVWVAEKRKV